MALHVSCACRSRRKLEVSSIGHEIDRVAQIVSLHYALRDAISGIDMMVTIIGALASFYSNYRNNPHLSRATAVLV
jgi:hypothetical protein